ncbi:MAG: CHAT domain-containing protein [Candidatus Accumulibacter similis]|nr:MAG: CHAT domain-containing protein [Candidatus Accumulibacter similis]
MTTDDPARTSASAGTSGSTRTSAGTSESLSRSATYFVSHSSGDDGVVRQLRRALAELDTHLAIDSREFYGGDPLETTIHAAIDRSSGVLVLVSPRAQASAWVGKELKYALAVQQQRGGAAQFPVVPLLLDGTPLGALEALFDEQPLYAAITCSALDAAPHAILVALRLRLPDDIEPQAQPLAEPVEELLLELSDPRLVTHADGRRRACARARLVHQPATPAQRAVYSARFALEAPLGVVEADDLRWYLEDYAVWPSPLLAERAQRIEAQLAEWGRLLHDAALPAQAVGEVHKSWAAIGAGRVVRRFSVEVDSACDVGTPESEVRSAREAATLLLGLPWELLHDGRSFLFQGADPVRVRRRLPGEQPVPVAVLATPIRVLLASPRPEDDACSYLDHRASAGPMVEAIEALAGQVELRLLVPPTLPALRDELERAQRAGQPYHVLHFDGHGVYDRHAGLGALCFEHPEDAQRARGRRRHWNVPSPELGALLRAYGIPLVFLEACQSAQAESANESVASALLKTGVGSVVAMSHSVLVETSRRFVEAFYRALSRGERVGSAMLAGQRELKDNPVRGCVFGVGEFCLHDWFVPVLYQDRDDPQLFRATPSRQTLEDWRTRLEQRLGELPDPPAHGFVGRSRELLELERLLTGERYAVLRGQGGEGKTALASEFARWRVRARQVQRAAFVSLETHSHWPAALDALGRQLVGQDYSVAAHASLDAALAAVQRELREDERGTLLVFDNLESVLAPPFAFDPASDAGDALAADEREHAEEILRGAAALLACGETRIVFTSREALPAPFAGEKQRLELDRLSRADAVQLVERALGLDAAGMGDAAEAQRAEIESLVDAVHGHARTLTLLAPALRERGPAATQADLVELIAALERRFPGQREHSLLASVELSLRRLPPELRERAQVLGVFHGAVDLNLLRAMMGWPPPEVQALGEALVASGLASAEPYNHLRLNPALCPYLAAQLSPSERAVLTDTWTDAMWHYAEFLRRESLQRSEMAAALTRMELPNLMALLERFYSAKINDGEATIRLTTTLHALLQNLNRPRLLARVAQARDAASGALGEAAWGHAQFEAECTRIEELRAAGAVGEALAAAQRLHARAQASGEAAYTGADYDLGEACQLLGRALRFARQADAALPLLAEAQRRFEAVEGHAPGCGAARMAAMCITERGDCLADLERLDEAAQAYEEAISLAQQAHDERQVAVGKGQLGTVRRRQRNFPEALAAFRETRKLFASLGEAMMEAVAWGQIGMVYKDAGNGEAAEDAYRQSLAISVQCNNVAGQASNLNQLGDLYANVLARPAVAVTHTRQAAECYTALGDAAGEGGARSILADTLRRLGRRDEARREIERALVCKRGLGHAALPWTTWGILADIEHDDGRASEARQASAQAREAFLAYRRDGGENHSDSGRLAAEIARLLLAGDTSSAGALLEQLVQQTAAMPDAPASLPAFLAALQRVVAGERSATLAETPGLHYSLAAEIVLLLEQLTAAGR